MQACEILRGHSTSTAASCPSLDLGLVQHGQKVERANGKPAGSQKRALAPKAMRLKKGLLKRKRQGVITRG